MARQEFSGSAVPAKLAGSIDDTDTSITIDDASGWPTGADNPFVVTIGRGQSSEETILCSARTGTTLTVQTRGYDGTSAQAHASGDDIEHTISAAIFEDLSDHVYDTVRDDHTQYLTGARHDARDHSAALATAAIGDLGDVDATAPSAGDTLVWDSVDEEWKPGSPFKIQAGVASIASTGGTTITFPEAFDDPPAVVVTPTGSGGGTVRVAFLGSVTTTGFLCALVNMSNVGATGTVHWIATDRTPV